MGTRSLIGIVNEDKSVDSIYCHWDGYPDHQEPILHDSYNTIEKVEELLDLGDLSFLGSKIAPQNGESHTFDEPAEDTVIAYCRDRGEPMSKPRHYKSEKTMKMQAKKDYIEYLYLFDRTKESWKTVDVFRQKENTSKDKT